MHKAMVCIVSLLAMSMAGCTDQTEGAQSAVICTNLGPITLDLFDDEAPITVDNFAKLAKSGYYDGVKFHRIITDFMMQGGDPEGTGRGGEAHGGGTIPDEVDNDLSHDSAGILSMANAGPNTGGSQFFITFAPTTWLDGKHTIFGKVSDGMETVEQVEEVAASGSGTPQADIFMQTVLIDQDASNCPEAIGLPEPVEPFACPLAPTREMRTPIDGDLITPGLLCITNTEDRSLVWARNHGTEAQTIEWSMTGAGGGALPDGWTISFDDASAQLGADGSNTEGVHTMLRVNVPDGTSGSFDLEFHTGHSTTPITAVVDLRHDVLTAKGDDAAVDYSGRCASNGETFDSGSFPLTLGGGRAITGFDLGLIGHGENEDVMIHIPAPLAYGDNGPVCAGDNADLIFDVTVTRF